MITLAIETSCDDTAAAVLNDDKILSNVVSSQIEGLSFGGIVPELASRSHMTQLLPVVQNALEKAEINKRELDLVAVTHAPGLIGSLLVGVNFAKAMAFGLHIPVIGVHHIEAHMLAAFIESPQLTFPFIALIVSGGHTQLTLAKALGEYQILGETADDAAGECYDKVARILNLSSDGNSIMAGPVIDKLAQMGNPDFFSFPRPMIKSNDFHFSFSGLKTAVLNFVQKENRTFSEQEISDICASFQEAVSDVLSEKTIRACRNLGISNVVLCGGVAANSRLRSVLKEKCRSFQIELSIPSPKYCTDNAAMIGITGYKKYSAGSRSNWGLGAISSLTIEKAVI